MSWQHWVVMGFPVINIIYAFVQEKATVERRMLNVVTGALVLVLLVWGQQ